jgi:uncharacterized membrane protein
VSLYSIFEATQNIGFLTDIRESALVYPVIMASHLTGMALFGGMILMTDLRLLGVAMRDQTVTQVVSSLRLYKRIGFCLVATCGLLMLGSEALKYYPNPYFWIKMSLLALVAIHALIFRPTVYNNTEALDKSPVMPTRAKVAASISLALWVSLVCAGRLIAYYEGPQKNANKSAQVIPAGTDR